MSALPDRAAAGDDGTEVSLRLQAAMSEAHIVVVRWLRITSFHLLLLFSRRRCYHFGEGEVEGEVAAAEGHN